MDIQEEEEKMGEQETTSASMGDDDSETASDESDDDVPPNQADDILVRAMNLKEEGNALYNKQKLDEAARSYRRGTNVLKKLNKNNTGDEQVKSLLMALQNNLSMVVFKQNKFRMSADVATRSLAIDPTNVKALYRRAVAYRKIGELERARSDLKEALQKDPDNTVCKKEANSIRKEMDLIKASQKKAMVKAFSGSFLYEDKEEAKKRKEEEERKKQQEEQELYKKRKMLWEDECVKRMANNEPVVSFEEWDEEQKKLEEQKEKEEKMKRKEAEKKMKEERKAVQMDEDSDDDELTEAELAMMRGYKKTKDGRMTSYFTRELSEKEKKLLDNVGPQRLDDAREILSSNCLKSAYEGVSKPSAWNQAGTWEEKDTTEWCKEALRKQFVCTKVSCPSHVVITSVENLTGEASVAITGGKKRYIFDFHARLKYKITEDEGGDVIAKGIVHLPDICSTDHEELEVTFEPWTKPPKRDDEQKAVDARDALSRELRKNVQQWVVQFNDQY